MQKELEHIFAEKFASDAFPILADLYYNKRQYTRAFKVCKVGLKHNPNKQISSVQPQSNFDQFLVQIMENYSPGTYVSTNYQHTF